MLKVDDSIRKKLEKIAELKEESFEEVFSKFKETYKEVKKFNNPPEILDASEVALRRLSSRTLSTDEKVKAFMPPKRVPYLCSIGAIC